VKVLVSGDGSATTDASGNYTFSWVPGGTYSLTATQTGYVSQTASVTVNDKLTTTANFTLVRIQYGNVTGKITDAYSGLAVVGATVSIVGDGSTVTDASGVYTLSSLVAGPYTLSVSKTAYTTTTTPVAIAGNATLTKNVTLTPATSNVALNKTFTATKTNGTNVASRAGDGSTSTYWDSGSLTSTTASQTLQVDLGAIYPVDTAVIYWNGSYYGRAYTVKVSADGVTWTTVTTVTSGTSGTKTHAFAKINARYVKLNPTSYNSSTGYRVNEFQIWTP
jgi:hypothetical protein